ncbi:MAG: hypothetical protein COT15_00980 [Candidatus Diapherotrites archaeon CG08_land_8_20_14_0_20_34_12]|nr:MAG: hypothetical protein COT15_00980 [Candidatus Diapherotrites archaeon CG08_land_8_20_14_0_20_34_12]
MRGQISLEFLISILIFVGIIGLLLINFQRFEKDGLILKLSEKTRDSYCSAIANSAYSTTSIINSKENCGAKNFSKIIFDMNKG